MIMPKTGYGRYRERPDIFQKEQGFIYKKSINFWFTHKGELIQ